MPYGEVGGGNLLTHPRPEPIARPRSYDLSVDARPSLPARAAKATSPRGTVPP